MSLIMDKYDMLEEEQNLRYFSFVFGFSQIMGALSVILVAVWMGVWMGGFGWSNPEQQFHFHPLLMVISMIFLYGEAILIYRVFRHEKKRFTKGIHAVLHSLIFVLFVVALRAVFSSHDNAINEETKQPAPFPNMYTLHSWIGLSTILLFCFQYLCGFISFLFPQLPLPVKQWYMPIHRFFGVLIFVASCASALMGISERAAWHVKGWKNFSSEGLVVNFLGVCIALYSCCVIYLVTNPRFQRRPLPEEESLHQLTTAD